MPIKRLSYPAEDKRPQGGDRGVDHRVGEAHVHGTRSKEFPYGDQLQVLDQITQEDITKMRRELQDFDWSSISQHSNITDALFGIMDEHRYVIAPITASIDENYVYTSEGWKESSGRKLTKLSAGSSEITVTMPNADKPNEYSIDISATNKQILKSVANKVDKVIGVTDNIMLFGDAGTLRDSGVNLSSLEKVSNKSSSTTSDSEETYATSKAVKTVNDKLDEAIARIGKLRGAVYNAFSSQGSSYVLDSIEVKYGGYSYKEGDKFGIVGLVDAELTAHVDDAGVVQSFEVTNGGMFDTDSATLGVYPKSPTTAILADRIVQVENPVYSYKRNTTLRDIEDPQLGDTCYVNSDELHEFARNLYTYKAVNDVTNGWVFTSCVSAMPMVKIMRYAYTLIGTATLTPLNEGDTMSLDSTWLSPYSGYGNMRLVLSRNGEEVLEWRANDEPVVVAASLALAAGNSLRIYSAVEDELLTEAQITVTMDDDGTRIMQFRALPTDTE